MSCSSGEKSVDCLKVLIGVKAPIDLPDDSKITPLRLALENGDLELARLLIDSHANLEERNAQGQTLLHLVAQRGIESILLLLLEKVPHLVDVADKTGITPIYAAIENNHRLCWKALLSKMKNLDIVNEKGETLLIFAAKFDRRKAVNSLIKKGANTELLDNEGMTAAHMAALVGAHSCLNKLLGENPSTEILSKARKDGKTLLHLAVISGKDDCVKAVLKHSVSLDVIDNPERGMTPAHYAAAAGNWGILELLLNKGFPVDFQNNLSKETCLMNAFKSHQFTCAEKLILAGASMRTPNSGDSPPYISLQS